VKRSDNIAWSEADGAAIASTRYPTSARLLTAIHRREEAAITELFLLYAPLLRDQARRMSIDPEERAEVVTTLLDDVVLHLMDNALSPRHLARYLVASLRNRARRHHRDVQRRRTIQEDAYGELGPAHQRIVAESHSEYALRASLSADAIDPLPLRSAIAKLAKRSAQALTDDEMIMMVGVGRHVPLRDMADQLGITYGAARVRLHRLRERFGTLAAQYTANLKPDEKREIDRFFRRAQVRLVQFPEEKTEQQAMDRAAEGQPEKNNGKT
jgi:DNA-directed RNA polymerase specialized sigma24 family protein